MKTYIVTLTTRIEAENALQAKDLMVDSANGEQLPVISIKVEEDK